MATNLATSEATHQAVRLLCDLDYLREEEVRETGGRPRSRYWINPRAWAA